MTSFKGRTINEISAYNRRNKKRAGNRWRQDWSGNPETSITIRGEWKYLYRAFDKQANTIGFLLSARRDKKAALRFLNNVVEQVARHCGHRFIKRIVRPILGFKSFRPAQAPLAGIELWRMLKKGKSSLPAWEQFYPLGAAG